jgi:ribonuclease BN (tRNA processing enzyme)
MASATLQTLGTGVALPDAERGPSCTLLRADGYTLAVDLGSGSLQKLAAQGVFPHTLDGLCLTHAHLDHLADLLPLLFALRIRPALRTRPLQILLSHACLAIVQRVQAALEDWIQPPGSAVQWTALDPGETTRMGPWHVHTGPVAHSASSIGYRFQLPDGPSICIPGDTGPTPHLTALARGVDLLLLECALPDDDALPVHMTPSQVADAWHAARPARLWLTHRYAELTEEAARNTLQARGVDATFCRDGDAVTLHGPI